MSVSLTPRESRSQRSETLGTQLDQQLFGPRRWGCRQVDRRQLVLRVNRRRPRPVRLVDRDVGQVVEDLGAPVGRRPRGHQLRALIDERRRDPPGLEIGIIEHRRQERNVRRHPANAELRHRPSRAPHRRREVAAPARQLDQHRIEVGTDLGAHMRPAIESDARTTRTAVRRDAPGIRTEPVRRVLGGDPALQRRPVWDHRFLAQPKVIPGFPRSRCAAATTPGRRR